MTLWKFTVAFTKKTKSAVLTMMFVSVFFDGTIIRIGYPKKDLGGWWIEVEKQGTAKQALTLCDNEDDDIYSDIFEIDAEIKSHSVIKQKYPDRP